MKRIEKNKKNKKKYYIALGTQEEGEKPVHSTEYDGRRRGHQPSSWWGWTDQF